MSELPVAATRYLAIKDRQYDRREAQIAEMRQREEDKKMRRSDERIKERVLREEGDLCRSDVCWTVTTIILLCIPMFGWVLLVALYTPCNCYTAYQNRKRVLEAASRGDRALRELKDLGDWTIMDC